MGLTRPFRDGSLPFIGFYGALEELDILELRIKRERLGGSLPTLERPRNLNGYFVLGRKDGTGVDG